MAQTTIEVGAETRVPGTKNDARRLRASGRVPAVLYGEKQAAFPLSLDPKPLLAAINSQSGHNRIFKISIGGGETTSAVVQDWLVDPVSDKLLHVDFKRIDLAKKLRARVPVHGVGEAPGVKTQGGILEFVVREVEIEALPLDVPDLIEVDVSEMVIGKNIRAKDLKVPDTVRVINPAEQLIAHIVVMKEEEVKAPEEVAAAAGTAAEPEVIKKGKKDEEEEGAKPEGKGDKKK